MKAIRFPQPLVSVSFTQFSVECSKFSKKLKDVISRNLRQNREEHQSGISQLDKNIERIRQMSKMSANIQNDKLNVSFFLSHVAPGKITG